MSNHLSTHLFERLSNLTNTLKLETIELLNKVSHPNTNKLEDSISEDSVILIESPDEVENNPFIKFIKEKQECLNILKRDFEDNYEKNCSSVSLEDLVNISVSLHTNIDESIECICNKMGKDSKEIEGFKSPLDESIPVSLFKSNIKQKFLNQSDGFIAPQDINMSKTDGSDEHSLSNETGVNNEIECGEVNVKCNSVETLKKVHNFSVYNINNCENEKRIDVVDLSNLGLSEETRKLLGLA